MLNRYYVTITITCQGRCYQAERLMSANNQQSCCVMWCQLVNCQALPYYDTVVQTVMGNYHRTRQKFGKYVRRLPTYTPLECCREGRQDRFGPSSQQQQQVLQMAPVPIPPPWCVLSTPVPYTTIEKNVSSSHRYPAASSYLCFCAPNGSSEFRGRWTSTYVFVATLYSTSILE